ncbi:hypothetical protein PVAP13_7NG004912 [Panicum virgatum]|uniref:Uncharacterized protein n=1 Tax=Panicum virgatum TaxID=38727 RepID=A0A8T0Q3X5_PANVG|nr:hypothetical protein PVAP13_7NG004912 [Panicum virgatum]
MLAPTPVHSSLPCNPPLPNLRPACAGASAPNRRLPDDTRAHLTGSLGPVPAAPPELCPSTVAKCGGLEFLDVVKLLESEGDHWMPAPAADSACRCRPARCCLHTSLAPAVAGIARHPGAPHPPPAPRFSDLTSCGRACLSPMLCGRITMSFKIKIDFFLQLKSYPGHRQFYYCL